MKTGGEETVRPITSGKASAKPAARALSRFLTFKFSIELASPPELKVKVAPGTNADTKSWSVMGVVSLTCQATAFLG